MHALSNMLSKYANKLPSQICNSMELLIVSNWIMTLIAPRVSSKAIPTLLLLIAMRIA